jgi:hypothetical protein
MDQLSALASTLHQEKLKEPLSVLEIKKIDAYWRAANYLSVGQIYLLDNPFLKQQLSLQHVKRRLLGDWGTTPGLNFIYAHLNRLIKAHDIDMIFLTGPGHGGPAIVADVYLEGTYSEFYPDISQNEEGMKKLFKQFSFPGGIPSHVAPEKNGSKILTINCRSFSIKVSLFDNDNGINNHLLDVHLKGVNLEQFKLEVISSRGKESTVITKNIGIAEGLQFIFDVITRKFDFTFSSLQGIGHRFVHGGSRYLSTTRIDPIVITDFEKMSYLAPLYNNACLLGIKECLVLGGSIPQVAVFDTAFHHSLPAVVANYAIASDTALKHQIKRYGFHGIANAFLWNTYVENIKVEILR